MAQRFTRLPAVPELPALEPETLEFWQRERVFDRLGADAQGRVPALQGFARLPPALPERLGLPGSSTSGGHPGEALLIWTTTPWTLPANVAAAVQPAITYGRLPSGDWVSVESQPEDVEFRIAKA